MLTYDFVDPAALTGFVREVPSPANFILNQFLPDSVIDDIEAVINKVTRTNRAAKFRAYDAETPIGKRDSFSQDRVLLPPLGEKRVIGEYERLQLQRLRGAQGDQIEAAIYDDGAANVRAIRARMELARGDVLTDGKFTLTAENGLTLEADFGVSGTHIVAPGTLWSNTAAATVLTNLRAWADTYTDDSGEPPGAIVTSRRVVSFMLQNAEIRALVGTMAGTPNLVTRTQLNDVLGAHGLPPVVEYDTRIDVDGTSTRPIADDRVVMMPANPRDLGETVWGITAEALELASEGRITLQDAPGITGVVLKEGDPVRIWSKASAVGMPLIYDPNRLMVADVA